MFFASLSGENFEEVRDSGGSKIAETVVFRRGGLQRDFVHTPTPILFRFNILLLKFAQIDEVIQRLCTPPEIVMSTINGTGTARTCFEIVNGNGLNHVSTKLTLDCISENCHKIAHCGTISMVSE